MLGGYRIPTPVKLEGPHVCQRGIYGCYPETNLDGLGVKELSVISLLRINEGVAQ